MKLSVIMANYNGGKYIREAINSVTNQNYHDYELIIIDDASTDNSREIINDACQPHGSNIKKFFVDENQGQAECINHGINNMSGEVACFIDSDDLWLPGKLASVYEVFSRRSNIALYQHNLFVMKGDQLTSQKYRDILVQGDYFAYVKASRVLPEFTPTTGLSIRADCLRKVIPVPHVFRISADGYLTRTSYCWGEVVSDSDCYGVYRVHDNNNTYGNSKYNKGAYVQQILYPALNRYYQENNIDFSYKQSLFKKVLDISLRKILRQYFRIDV